MVFLQPHFLSNLTFLKLNLKFYLCDCRCGSTHARHDNPYLFSFWHLILRKLKASTHFNNFVNIDKIYNSLCVGMCGSRNYLYYPHGRSLEIPRGRGDLKAKLLEGQYEAKLEFPGGCGGAKKPSVGGVWIFSGTTQCCINNLFFLIDSHGYKFNDVNDKLYSKQSTDTIN